MLWPAAYQQKVCYRLLKTEEEERGGCTFEGIKSEGRSAQKTVETLNDGWCDREGLDGGRWSAVTTAKGRSWKKTTATLTVNYHFSDYTCVWLVNMSALRWGIFNISFTDCSDSMTTHLNKNFGELCRKWVKREIHCCLPQPGHLQKKGYIKKQNKKNSPKVTVCVIPPPTPTAGCFCERSRVWYNWTEESWKALWNYMCAASPSPPPIPQIIITLPNKQKDGLVPFSWFGFRVPGIV